MVKHSELCWGLILFFVATPFAYAVAKYEHQRTSERVTYVDGSAISVDCNSDCKAIIEMEGNIHELSRKDVGADIRPSNAILFLDDVKGSKKYTAWLEVDCDQYAELPPYYVCMVSLTMDGDEIVEMNKFKRFTRDEPYE